MAATFTPAALAALKTAVAAAEKEYDKTAPQHEKVRRDTDDERVAYEKMKSEEALLEKQVRVAFTKMEAARNLSLIHI